MSKRKPPTELGKHTAGSAPVVLELVADFSIDKAHTTGKAGLGGSCATNGKFASKFIVG